MATSPIDIRFATLSSLDRSTYNGATLNSLIANVEELTFLFEMESGMLTVLKSEDTRPDMSEATRPCDSISAAQEYAYQMLMMGGHEPQDHGWTVVL